MTETIENGRALIQEPTSPPTLFGTADPAAIVRGASERATVLADVIRSKKLSVNISGRDHVRIEGWTLLGTLLGVFPVTVWSRPTETGWEARVEARTLSGAVVGAAEAECSHDEGTWKNRPSYALRSMAQTRATSKALRMPLGFVMTLAGYDPTPAEEMEHESPAQSAQRRAVAPAAPRTVESTVVTPARPAPTASGTDKASDQQKGYVSRLLSDVGIDWATLVDEWGTPDGPPPLPGNFNAMSVEDAAHAIAWLTERKAKVTA